MTGARTTAGYSLWTDLLRRAGESGEERVEVRFVGRGPTRRPPPRKVLAAVEPTAQGAPAEGAPAQVSRPEDGVEVAWSRQIHSARVLEASPGLCGEGDALWTDRRRLALSVVTADCVPILFACRDFGGEIAAVHAGWRGIASDIVARTVERLAAAPAALIAWIGPAIGSCCYEVGPEVAERVTRVSTEEAVRPNPDPGRPNPHLDLRRAVRHQLAAAGVGEIRTVDRCTRCHPEELWSYRRDGKAAGRNFGFVWVG